MAIAAVLIFVIITVAARRAQRAVDVLRAAQPDVAVVNTYWSSDAMDFFLKPGPLMKKARGRGFHVLLTADENGIELSNSQTPDSFGLIPWNLVKDVRMDELRAALASRPMLVIEIRGDTTPYKNRIELVPSGKAERARAADIPAAILAKRPETDRRTCVNTGGGESLKDAAEPPTQTDT